jgi:predicted acetyltransferase
MKPVIRHLQGEEMFEALYSLNQYAFHPSPPFQNKEEWLSFVRGRKGVTCHAVFEDDEPFSVAASTSMTQNIRDKLFPASGVWGVATSPTARRKGYCREVMGSLLSAERESGKVFTNLYPFRESFYERLGYVAFPLTKIARFTPDSLAPLLKMDSDGQLELKLISEGFEAYRAYLVQMRQSRHGMGFFDIPEPAAINRNALWAGLAMFGGQLEGVMLYRMQGEEVGKFNFSAVRFYYQTSRARYLMLNWIARHVDQADRAELWLPADEYPETWLADMQVKVESAIRPAMCRILDVEKIGGMGVGEGSFSAHITDPLCPWNEGAWRFEAHAGILQVSKSTQADCELTIQGLSALVSGTHDPQDFPLRGWGNPTPELQAVQRSMFPRLCPFMHEMF